ncbi:hypothetical protein [Marinobacter sp. P4B1]|uniref:hypothetical protein n=1 Tax=Marinobacter sp. P4B1 TaxID=1119533 RepID=UPI00071C40A1|nr:hypothetical protein [Marinobacter sp. P4B1]KRW83707.1 hypothetical protein AQ621_16795 [Marinobacter sp. P4B1]
MKKNIIAVFAISTMILASGCSSNGGSIIENPVAGYLTGGNNAILGLGDEMEPEQVTLAKRIIHLSSEPGAIDDNGNLRVAATVTGVRVEEMKTNSRAYQNLTENYGGAVVASNPLNPNNGRIDAAMQIGSRLADSVFGSKTVEVTKYELTTESGYRFEVVQPENFPSDFQEGDAVIYRSAKSVESSAENAFFMVKR